MAKRLKHALKLGIGHEADLLVFLAVQLAQPRELYCGPSLQLLLEVFHQGFDGLEGFGVHHAALGHEFVGNQAVVGGQRALNRTSREGGRFGVWPRRTTLSADCTQISQAGKHHAVVVPKHTGQHVQHVRRGQRGGMAQ